MGQLSKNEIIEALRDGVNKDDPYNKLIDDVELYFNYIDEIQAERIKLFGIIKRMEWKFETIKKLSKEGLKYQQPSPPERPF